MEERRPPSPSSHPPPVFVYTSHHVGSIPIGTSRVRIDASVTRIPPMAFVPLGPDLLELEFDPSGNLLEIGRRAFHGCVNATFRADTNLPRTISVIQDEAFGSCRSLTEVNIPPGVIAIRGGTFRDCSSLSRCYLPPTVRVIMSDALGSTSIDDGFVLPRDIDEIGDAAFRDAKFRRMIIPSSISVIGRHLLFSCERMFSLELSTNIRRIKNYAFMDCITLRNVVIPPNAGRGGLDCFHGCRDLLELFGTNRKIKDALRVRFRNLPIHSACYYHAHADIRTTISRFDSLLTLNNRNRNNKNVDDDATSADATSIGTYGGDRDCLGMTPLHILACSKCVSIELYAYLRNNFESATSRYDVTEDGWGCLPIFYALLGDASIDVRDMYLNDLRRTNPNHVFDVRRLIENLCRCGASLRAVQFVFDMDRNDMFPHEYVDWDQFVDDLASSTHATRVPVEVFGYLIRRAISDRVGRLGVERYRIAILDEIGRLPTTGNMRHTELRGIKLKLAWAEYTYDNLREATFVLELALWKARMNECNIGGRGMKISSGKIPTNKRARMDKEGCVYHCRMHCGAEIVIRNVLPYLIENMI
jgi:hypothetical protein